MSPLCVAVQLPAGTAKISKETKSLGMPWEKEYGYAQAVKVGDAIYRRPLPLASPPVDLGRLAVYLLCRYVKEVRCHAGAGPEVGQ